MSGLWYSFTTPNLIKTYIVNGMQNKGTTVSLNATKTVSLNDIQPKYSKHNYIYVILLG